MAIHRPARGGSAGLSFGRARTPEPPRDGLPNPPEIDEDIDIAQAGHPPSDTLALHAGPGPAPSARIPDAYFAAAAGVPSARAYAPVPPAPVRGSLREDGAFVPEGQPSDWDLPSAIPPR